MAWACVRGVLQSKPTPLTPTPLLDDEGPVDSVDPGVMSGTWACLAGWAEMWELRVEPGFRRRGVATWLVRTAAAWLRLGGSSRMLADVAPDMEAPEMDRFYARFGWHEIGRSRRGWRRLTAL